jgi:23S rRNA (adenine2503-C2)-methyltransferase
MNSGSHSKIQKVSKLQILATTGKEEVAIVYIAELGGGSLIEFVEAVQPPLSRDEKWVLLVSTMFGCPVGCKMCDAGGYYHGKASREDIFAQIEYLVQKRYPDRRVPSRQFKIQFARMGEPSFNPAVLEVIDELPSRYDAPGFMPSISTVAPRGTRSFFEKLLEIKLAKYSEGRFQFQFSIHTTDEQLRDEIIPVKKWGFREMAVYGERFFRPGDRKITLNFALANGMPVDSGVLLEYFDPDKFLVKITPLNPTYQARESGFTSYIDPEADKQEYGIVRELLAAGYQVIVSIGEVEENYIGSNCGQYVRKHLESAQPIVEGYTYPVEATKDQ